MSADTIKQRADEEADAAEAEFPDAEPEPDPEPEPEPEPEPAPMGEKEIAALGKKIDAENERHEKRLRELYGEHFADMRDCPLCLSEGFLLPIPLEARDPAQVEAVHAALGENEQPELQMLEGVERCPKCDGWGRVATPSKNAENQTKTCLACDSRGYRETIPDAYSFPPPPPAPMPYANGTNPPPVSGEVDPWNRPAGSRYYGVVPGQET